jgi:hypothetical protein
MIEQFAFIPELTGVDFQILETFMLQHANEYTPESDQSFWFAGQTRLSPANFESMGRALIWAFSEFPEGPSVEEMIGCFAFQLWVEQKENSPEGEICSLIHQERNIFY